MPRGFPPAPPAQPERILRPPPFWERQHREPSAGELHDLCLRHPSGITGVARELGVIPQTIHRHLKYDPGSGKDAPCLSERANRRLRKLLAMDG